MRERYRAALFVTVWVGMLMASWAGIAATAPGTPRAASDAISVHLRIEAPAWEIVYAPETRNNTVFRVLQEASAILSFELDWVEYGWPYHDVLVTSINGTRSDGTAGLYWQYCVNGAYATRGALQQEVRDGDSILWVYAPTGGSELCH